jgi:hypothetical protein
MCSARQSPHGEVEYGWIGIQIPVGCAIAEANTLATGATQRLFLTVAGAVAHETTLSERDAIKVTLPIRAVQRVPIHLALAKQ